jgi:hypothetical protein
MAETDAERALRYRNSAEHIRIEAVSIENENERVGLLRIAADFDALAEDIERAAKH